LDYLTIETSLSPIRRRFAPGFVNYKKGCTRLAVARDNVYQLLANGRWFYPGTPASSTIRTGRQDIAESDVKTPTINQSMYYCVCSFLSFLNCSMPEDFVVSSLIVNFTDNCWRDLFPNVDRCWWMARQRRTKMIHQTSRLWSSYS